MKKRPSAIRINRVVTDERKEQEVAEGTEVLEAIVENDNSENVVEPVIELENEITADEEVVAEAEVPAEEVAPEEEEVSKEMEEVVCEETEQAEETGLDETPLDATEEESDEILEEEGSLDGTAEEVENLAAENGEESPETVEEIPEDEVKEEPETEEEEAVETVENAIEEADETEEVAEETTESEEETEAEEVVEAAIETPDVIEEVEEEAPAEEVKEEPETEEEEAVETVENAIEEADETEEVAEETTESEEETEAEEAVEAAIENPDVIEEVEEEAESEEKETEEKDETEAAEQSEPQAKPEKEAFKLTAPANLEEILANICVKRGRKLIYRPNEILFNCTANVIGTDKDNEEGIKVKNILDEEIKQGVKLGYIDKYDGLKMSEIKEEYENDIVYEYAEQEFKRTGLVVDGDKIKVYIYDWDMKALHHVGYVAKENVDELMPYLTEREKYSFDICGLITGGKYRKVIKDEASGKVTVEKGNDGKLGMELDISVINRKD